ncbi:MAG: hypothetical protein JNK53_05105, partial [Phycisphaerae bacterium]|nr:hypothetical protein [Phycisphaerae bacterium]
MAGALALASHGAGAAAAPQSAPANDRTIERAPQALATPTPPPGPVGAATASADSDGVHAQLSLAAPKGWQPGAPVQVRIAVTLPEGARLDPSSVAQTLGAWDVRDVRMERGADARSATVRMTLTAWEAGTIAVPAIPVHASLPDGRTVQLSVGPLEVSLETLLAEGTPLTELAAPIRGPVDIATMRWLLIVAAAVGAAITLWLATYLFRRSRAVAVAPPLPPDVWALRELDRLESERLPARSEFGVFFARLSDIVRHYVEQRWGISAPEQTTKEFLRDARTHPELAGGHERTLAQFLRDADMVK